MSTTKARPRRGQPTASEAQMRYIDKLFDQRVVPDELLTYKGVSMTGGGASWLIDQLTACAWKPRENEPARPTAKVTAEGVYFKDGEVFKVKQSYAGRFYASRLRGTTWDYDPKAVFDLTDDHLLTLEQAKEYGVRVGVCAMCGRTLTDPKSIAFGLGTHCIKKFKK